MRKRIDRSRTAIPCYTALTQPLLVGGLPRDIFMIYGSLVIMSIVYLKNIFLIIPAIIIYLLIKKINKKDPTTVEAFLKENRKKYISY